VDESGKVSMVDVGSKSVTERYAMAQAKVYAAPSTLKMIINNEHKKGDVLTVAHIAGIQAAKKTSDLIPLCHPLSLNSVKLHFEIKNDHILVECLAKVSAKTGVEMEALTGASIACLTIYDMCKAVDKEMVISELTLMEKTGGNSKDIARG
tara:strand:- start:576 stop:1028 length:453 start_codon:yes stop_codon:yes gene_type:complete